MPIAIVFVTLGMPGRCLMRVLRLKGESMLIYGVGALSALLCFCALLLDVSLFEQTKVRAQNAADAAAIGAVFDYQNGGSYTRGGTADASLNGFTAGNGTTVTISNPPTTGAYAGNTYAVQATVTTTAKGTFLPGTKTITARATAMGIGPTPCVYMLSKAFPAQPSLYIGNQTNQYTCSTYLGSSYSVSGGFASSSQYFVAGNSSNSSGSPSPAAIFGAPTLADPLAYLTPPTIGSCATVSGTTLNPGTYCGGIQLSDSGSYTLNPGVYISQAPLIINGPNLTGTGRDNIRHRGFRFFDGKQYPEHQRHPLCANVRQLARHTRLF